jgi:hypothetical protein
MLGMYTPWRTISSNRIDGVLSQGIPQVLQHTVSVTDKRRGKAAPKYPAGTLQYALAFHIFYPPVWPVASIPVTFDSQTCIVMPLHNHIDSVMSDLHLRRYPVAALSEFVEHLPLEIRFTFRSEIFNLLFILRKGGGKMLDELSPQIIRRVQLIQLY